MADDRACPEAGRDDGAGPLCPEAWRRLASALAAGQQRAFDVLYVRVSRRLFGLALWRTGSAEDAAEVVQEAFVRLVQQGRALARIEQLESWLLTVTHRLSVDVTRRRQRRQTRPLEDYPFLRAREDDPARRLDAERASALLARLPAEQREVIYLHDYCEESFSAIGSIVGVPTFTAASRYRLGIRKLRRLMEESP